MPLEPEAADHQGQRNRRGEGQGLRRGKKSAVQGLFRRAEVRRQKKTGDGMFGMDQAVILQGIRGGRLPGQGGGEGGLPPGLLVGLAQ